MRFSMSEFLSDVSADGTTIALDMPGAGYDRLHDLLERKIKLPQGKAGRVAIIAVMLVASRLIKQQLGPMGPISNFFNEIGEDAVREEAKRILESVGRTTADRQLIGSPAGAHALWEMDDASRRKLLEQFRRLDTVGQQQMREQMLRTTTMELAALAGMSHEDVATILSIMSPVTTKGPGIVDRFATTLFPWLA